MPKTPKNQSVIIDPKNQPVIIEYREKKETSGPTMFLAWVFVILAILGFFHTPTGATANGTTTKDVTTKVEKNVHP